VAATLAMMVNQSPEDTYINIINRLRLSVDPHDSLTMTTISGGCLNINRALTPIAGGRLDISNGPN